MKKKLEAELISIAHRILKMKNKEDVVQLHQEAQKLYEKLSILRFYEENIAALKPTMAQEELEKKMEQAYEEPKEATPEVKAEVVPEISAPILETPTETPVEEEKVVVGEITIEDEEIEEEEPIAEIEEPVVIAEEEEVLLFEPASEKITEEVKEEKKAEPQQISFEDLLGNIYTEPEFVKVNDVPKEVEKTADIAFEKVEKAAEETKTPEKKEVIVEETSTHRPLESIKKEIEAEKAEYRSLSLNDKFNKTITLTLNDRIAFEKNLFGGSGEDLNRVLSQLNTFNSLGEAKSFIDDLVKPDYNDWKGKEEYSERFMELVEKKFA